MENTFNIAILNIVAPKDDFFKLNKKYMALPQKMISVSKRIISNFVRRHVAELWKKMPKFFRIDKF